MISIINNIVFCGSLLILAFMILLAMPKSMLRCVLLEILGWMGGVLAAVYVVSPIDIIPDFIPIAGWIDDGGAIIGGVASVVTALSAGEGAEESLTEAGFALPALFSRGAIMGLMDGFIEGISQGIANWATGEKQPQRNGRSHGRIERWCAELGWEVDERDESVRVLFFNDKHGQRRRLYVSDGGETFIIFRVYSTVEISSRRLGGDVMAYLLCRNHEECATGAWGISLEEDKTVRFTVDYVGFGDGLDANMFNHVCSCLISEVADFDDKLRAEDLL